jgi:hypothetical protein
MSRTPEIIRQIHTIEETSIRLFGDWDTSEADILSTSWLNALALDHKLPNEIKTMDGMSGKKYRYLINNLVGLMPNARYLEIGSWAGSTACSAMWGNKCKVTCIDNWSEFGGPKDAFFANTSYCKTDDIDFNFIESDFRKVDYSNIGKYNVYMFDGPHSEQDQYDGIALVEQALDDTYILIVDDYNGSHVRKGTQDALDKCGHKVLAKIEVITHIVDGEHALVSHQYSDWHNGYLFAVVQKNK